MLSLLITIVIWGLIFYVAWWALGKMALSEPFNKIATVILVIAVLCVLIGILNGNIHSFTAFKL